MDVLALLSPLTAPADSTLRHFLKNICQLSLWTTKLNCPARAVSPLDQTCGNLLKGYVQQGQSPLPTKPVDCCQRGVSCIAKGKILRICTVPELHLFDLLCP